MALWNDAMLLAALAKYGWHVPQLEHVRREVEARVD